MQTPACKLNPLCSTDAWTLRRRFAARRVVFLVIVVLDGQLLEHARLDRDATTRFDRCGFLPLVGSLLELPFVEMAAAAEATRAIAGTLDRLWHRVRLTSVQGAA